MTPAHYTPPSANYFGPEEKLCSTCNAVIHRKAEICPKCGVRQRKPANKTVLLLLTLYLGVFGAHRFYLGNDRLGILYLLFCWTGIPGLIALIELIVFLFMSREKIENDYTAHDLISAIAIFTIIIPFLWLIGILIAVAIPAYVDYTNKSTVTEVMNILSATKIAVNDYIANTKQFPSTEDLEKIITLSEYVAYKQVAYIEANPQGFYIQATLKEDSGTIAGKTIRWTYDQSANKWICRAGSPNGMDNKYLPYFCRKQ